MEKIGAQAAQERYRRRREEAVNRLVAEVKVGETQETALGDESEASHYREAEAIARQLHEGR